MSQNPNAAQRKPVAADPRQKPQADRDGPRDTPRDGPRDGPAQDVRAHGSSAPSTPGTAGWIDRAALKPFFQDDELQGLRTRALSYLRAGLPVHLSGPAGIGKSTLALHLAQALERPVMFFTGDVWVSRSDLVGREIGHSTTRVHDNYIASVRRTESRSRVDWRDAPLVAAMLSGATFIYDEFTRSTAEANAALLSVLEERVLANPDPGSGRTVVEAHPEFRMILTSNPADYAGVTRAPDALLDRMVTFPMHSLSESAEAGIAAAASGLAESDAVQLVRFLRSLRAGVNDAEAAGLAASARTAILIARLLVSQSLRFDPSHPGVAQICVDVLCTRLVEQPDGKPAAALAALAHTAESAAALNTFGEGGAAKSGSAVSIKTDVDSNAVPSATAAQSTDAATLEAAE